MTEMKPQIDVLLNRLRISAVILLLLCSLHFPSLISASTQGFISIDCGGQSAVPYTDENEIVWTSDSGLLKAGVAKTVAGASQTSLSKPLTTVRYFPGDEQKNCYALQPVQIGSPYLIRATFLYGNYDGQNQLPITFDLLLDSDLWATVIVSQDSPSPVYELYVLANATFISVCLARSGTDNPFISTLELRPLANNMNTMYLLKNRYALYSLARTDYGSESNNSIRYPDDMFDRIWYGNPIQPSTVTAQPITSFLTDQPPSKVMMTAFGSASSSKLTLTFKALPGSHPYFLALYFAELGDANKEGQRVFDIKVNAEEFYHPLDVYKESGDLQYRALEVYTNRTLYFENRFNITFTELNTSTVGPIISALELFRVSDNPLSAGTFEADVKALANVMAGLNMTDWIGDPCLPASYKYDWLTCSSTVPPRITSLSLSKQSLEGSLSQSINLLTQLTQISLDGNSLTGPIPDLSQLKNLEKLDLQNNNLTGPIPESLATLPKLSELLLQNNNLSGAVPATLLQKSASSSLNFQYTGNNNLCDIGLATCSSVSGKKSKNALTIPLGITAAVVSVVGICIAFFFFAKPKQTIKEETNVGTPLKVAGLARYFTFEEVQIATNNFAEKIGQGGFGEVFHGILSNGEHVAVKVLSKQSGQGLPEFLNEVDILSRVHHKNLVSLVGYSNHPEHILIYEYMAGGDLRDRLFGRPGEPFDPVPWRTRLRIAVDAAQGLEYLHTGCKPSIIHRDVKSSNLLLDDMLQAKVADFGLSRFKIGDDVTHVSTQNIVGTAGYLDPEYYATLQMTDKSDVYSFGVLLLELVSGRPPVETSRDPPNIVEWVRPFLLRQGNVQDVVDPTLGRGYNLDAMWKVAEVAIRSTEKQRASRPGMGEVVSELKEALRMEMGTARGNELSSIQHLADEEMSYYVDEQHVSVNSFNSFRVSEEMLSLRPR